MVREVSKANFLANEGGTILCYLIFIGLKNLCVSLSLNIATFGLIGFLILILNTQTYSFLQRLYQVLE